MSEVKPSQGALTRREEDLPPLLPLPEPGEAMSKWAYHETDMEAYARANMEPLIEQLSNLAQALAAQTEQVKHYKAENERLAEALRAEIPVLRRIAGFGNMSDEMTEGVADRLESALHPTAALDQEGRK